MNTSPKGWIAALLGFLSAPLAMLYVRKPRWALFYLLLLLSWGILEMLFLPLNSTQATAVGLIIAVACAMHAYRLALATAPGTFRPWYSKASTLLTIACAYLFCAISFRAFLYEPFRYPSDAMSPAITRGSLLVVSKWGFGHYDAFGFMLAHRPHSKTLQRGDVVAFERPELGQSFVYRITGLPGDSVSYSQRKLAVNGVVATLDQLADYMLPDFGRSTRFRERLDDVEYEVLNAERPLGFLGREFPAGQDCVFNNDSMNCTIPAGHYFVMGDNRDHANDSRMWGFLPAGQVIGKIVAVYP